MANFKDWASRTGSPTTPLRRVFSPGIVAPPPAPQFVDASGAPFQPPRVAQPPSASLVLGTPPPAPMGVVLSVGVTGRGPVVPVDPVPPSNQLVKVDTTHPDPFEQLMAGVPDIAKRAGVQAPAVDATRMAGAPPGVMLEKWTPNTRYYTGASDASSDGRFDQHRQLRDAQIVKEQ